MQTPCIPLQLQNLRHSLFTYIGGSLKDVTLP